MKILITNIWLKEYAGTEVYVRDLVLALKKSGHEIEVYSPALGRVAQEIKQGGIHVVDNPANLKNTPDIIHAHHFVPTIEVMRRFQHSPVIYFVHDRTNHVDVPPKLQRIVKYVAVDHNCLEKLTIENKIPESQIEILYNWVDVKRFKRREKLNPLPLRALVFSNSANPNNHF